MSQPLISIIIPMYKVADYVTRCIESLQHQDIDKNQYEIICINDGSPDNCQEIVENLQKKYSNIVLLNQENQGVSMARNNGIAIAKGKYILPIDPDDYVVPNCFKSLLNKAISEDLDVLYAAFEIFDIDGKSVWRTNYSNLVSRVDDGYRGYFSVKGPNVRDPDRSWAIFYKLELLKNYQIDYPKDVPFLEDGLFLGKVFYVARRVGYSNVDFYQRTTRIGSATNSKLNLSLKAREGYLLALDDIIKFKEKVSIEKKNKKVVNFIISQFVLLFLFNLIDNKDKSEYLKAIKHLQSKKICKFDFSGVTQAHKNYLYTFIFSPILLFHLRRYIYHLNRILGL